MIFYDAKYTEDNSIDQRLLKMQTQQETGFHWLTLRMVIQIVTALKTIGNYEARGTPLAVVNIVEALSKISEANCVHTSDMASTVHNSQHSSGALPELRSLRCLSHHALSKFSKEMLYLFSCYGSVLLVSSFIFEPLITRFSLPTFSRDYLGTTSAAHCPCSDICKHRNILAVSAAVEYILSYKVFINISCALSIWSLVIASPFKTPVEQREITHTRPQSRNTDATFVCQQIWLYVRCSIFALPLILVRYHCRMLLLQKAAHIPTYYSFFQGYYMSSAILLILSEILHVFLQTASGIFYSQSYTILLPQQSGYSQTSFPQLYRTYCSPTHYGYNLPTQLSLITNTCIYIT